MKAPETMKSLLTALVALALTASATPAMAYVVQITTSIDLANVGDGAQVDHAVAAAVDDILSHAIAFSPTVVVVQNARVVAGRMYLLLVIADEDGENILEAMSAATSPSASDSDEPSE